MDRITAGHNRGRRRCVRRPGGSARRRKSGPRRGGASSDGRIVDVRIGADVGNVGRLPRRGSTPTSSRPGSSTCRSTAASGWRSGEDAAALRALAARAAVDGRDDVPAHRRSAAAPRTIAPWPRRFAAARGAAGARMPGLHLEGPLLAPARAGAHAPAAIAAAAGDAGRRAGASCSPRASSALVTLAPERPGALALDRGLRQAGIVVEPGPHRRDVRADGRGDRRGRDAGRPTSTTRCRRFTTARRAPSAPRWPTIASRSC